MSHQGLPCVVIESKDKNSNPQNQNPETMTYDQLIASSPVVLVEFFATWCPHCQKMMPVVEQVKMLLDGRAEIYQLDIDQNQQTADDAGAKSVPTFILYRDGKEVWRQSGEIDGEVLLGKVESFI